MPLLPDSWLDALRPHRRPIYAAWSRRLKGGWYLGAIALLAIGYRLLIDLVYLFPLPSNLPTYPIWPPAAYSQLILLLLGLKFWPAVALGSLLNTFLSPDQPMWTAGLNAAVNNTLTALIGAWLLLKVRFSPQLDHRRDVAQLIILAGLIPATLSATIGILYCCWSTMDLGDLGMAWFNWWIGNVSSVLILFPTVLTLPDWKRLFRLQTPTQRVLGLVWIGGLMGLSWFVFAAPGRAEIAPFPLEYLPFPLIAWGALILGPPGAATAILLTTGCAYWGFIQNQSPFFQFSTESETAILAVQTYICVVVITALSLAASTAERERARTELQIEKEKSEHLLLNILPQPIAHRLKQQESTIADHFAEVTVLFADIVDFTRLSTELSPQVLVGMLNDIFSTFDGLAEKHNLEKIKTIGDAYMVVGGLPEHRDDHAAAIAAMALDMQTAIVTLSQQHKRPFKMRIGINTGPVIAGVIGKKKFIYDLWGDTVNIASRMESSGIAGEIQVTDATYKALKGEYIFDHRGEVAVKGKGPMETYLLRGYSSASVS
ncbi:MAG: adenylate/guanylate cyclase domain-containing protein [Cyanobacteria bacterium P01_F01_bin.86]